MSIESVGSMRNIIKNHQGKEWVSDLKEAQKVLILIK